MEYNSIFPFSYITEYITNIAHNIESQRSIFNYVCIVFLSYINKVICS